MAVRVRRKQGESRQAFPVPFLPELRKERRVGARHRSRLQSPILDRLFEPVDISTLVFFRLAFGTIMLWEVVRYFQYGWIGRYWVEPRVFFPHQGFSWLSPWPGNGMYVHFVLLGILALCILTGFCYRASSALFFLGFTYIFLLDKTNYLNHFYLISLLSFLMIFMPAHRRFSVDSALRPAIRSDTVPRWTTTLLAFQIAIPYIYGGIAKINGDWLRGEPMREWLLDRKHFPVAGPWFDRESVVYLFSYGGLFLDLLVVPLLLWRPTRYPALAMLVLFHLTNAWLFRIGIFPWFMLAASAMFFPFDWCRQALAKIGIRTTFRQTPSPRLSRTYMRAVIGAVGLYCAVQVLFPFRHHLYPGNVSWTEEGHRFSWHMKLRSKSGRAMFVITDPATGKRELIDPADYLSRRQADKMATQPDMIWQFSRFLAEHYRKEKGIENVEVRARGKASLNGRKAQALIDPTVDLAAIPSYRAPASWIVPLSEPLKGP